MLAIKYNSTKFLVTSVTLTILSVTVVGPGAFFVQQLITWQHAVSGTSIYFKAANLRILSVTVAEVQVMATR